MRAEIDAGRLRDTGRVRMPGASEVARRLTAIGREMGVYDQAYELSPQTVFNWRKRGVPKGLIPVIAKLMGIDSEEYWRIARAPTNNKPDNRKISFAAQDERRK